MSRICYADALLDITLSATVIKQILTQGATLGFKYYTTTIADSLMMRNMLSIDDTVNIILKKLADSETGAWDRSVNIDFMIQYDHEELFAYLSFDHKNGNLTNIELVSLGCPWYKKTSLDYEIIDWNLYVSLLIELCKNFAILQISTIDENFNWYSVSAKYINNAKERFWIKAIIDGIPLDSGTLTVLLEQCSQEKIPFYNSNNFPHEKHELSAEQAVANFLQGLHPVNPYYSFGLTYNDEPFLLELYRHESEPSTWVQLSALGTIHCKKGETGIMRIDLAYYAKLLLILCKNLPLIEFCTVIDGESSTQSA